MLIKLSVVTPAEREGNGNRSVEMSEFCVVTLAG